MTTAQVCVYIATSIDGFIAGPNDDLSWLPTDEELAEAGSTDDGALGYEDFIAGIGALLMGRATYDVVRSFDVPWPYGDRPVFVATTRAMDEDPPITVRAVHGAITELVDTAKDAAGGKDVYLDGGSLIRQAAESDLIDELTITMAPIALGSGHPLFAGMSKRYPLDLVSQHRHAGGMIQIRARPKRPSTVQAEPFPE
jgi:dihydrofolate reductase